ncbi:MAG: hypothetical protein B7Y90_11485 [Alphaproteobacteria bacterium 32-64-14]|nr:MAG: hypothetical protein B7Y90_11485 [Alphaproteobacteria bacterium 32-64-14]
MIAEHAYAVLTRDMPEHGLASGDVGVVIHIHRQSGKDEPIGYMLELFTVDGRSIGEVSVPADAVRAVNDNDRVQVRPVAAE